jgi:uncharacterized protein
MPATDPHEPQLSEASESPRSVSSIKRRPRRGGSVAAQKWSRIIHVYTSMIALIAVLFFAVTGVTLNHPNWTFGGKVERTTVEGTLPEGWNADGVIDWLLVAEHYRQEHDVRGLVAEKDGDVTDGSITFKGAAYQADAFFNEDGSYELTIETQGAMAVLNDLHKGRNTTSSWRWLIDVSGIALAMVSFTGIFLQLFLRKRRRAAFVSAAAGGVVVLTLAWITLQ